MVNNPPSHTHRFSNEVVRIRDLISIDWVITMEHTLREGNYCADGLAKLGAATTVEPLIVLPLCIAHSLLADAARVSFVRL